MKFYIYFFIINLFITLFYLIKFNIKYFKNLNNDIDNKKKYIQRDFFKTAIIQLLNMAISIVFYIIQSNSFDIENINSNIDVVDIIIMIFALCLLIICVMKAKKHQNLIEKNYNIELDYLSIKGFTYVYFPFIVAISLLGIKYNLIIRYYSVGISVLYLCLLILLIIYMGIFLVAYFKKNSKLKMIFSIFLIILFVLTLVVDIFNI